MVEQADGLESAPDLGHVLDADPVQLDVLPVGEVGGVAAELGGDAADHAELLGRELPAVDAHAQHEVLVFELVRLEGRGLAAVDAGLALRVEAPPAEAAVQVGAVDRREAALGVDALDALAHGEAAVLLLPDLVGVERLGAVDLPLAVRAGGGTRRAGGRRQRSWARHPSSGSSSVWSRASSFLSRRGIRVMRVRSKLGEARACGIFVTTPLVTVRHDSTQFAAFRHSLDTGSHGTAAAQRVLRCMP